jgi:hypothetical protein
VPVLDIQAALQAMIDREACIRPFENFTVVAIDVLGARGTAWSCWISARRDSGGNEVAESTGDERSEVDIG